jgi:hypothetical protein
MTKDEERRRNVEALTAAGVIKEGLPEAYHSVFEDLSNEEIAVVMLLKARLDGVKARVDEDYERFVPL